LPPQRYHMSVLPAQPVQSSSKGIRSPLSIITFSGPRPICRWLDYIVPARRAPLALASTGSNRAANGDMAITTRSSISVTQVLCQPQLSVTLSCFPFDSVKQIGPFRQGIRDTQIMLSIPPTLPPLFHLPLIFLPNCRPFVPRFVVQNLCPSVVGIKNIFHSRAGTDGLRSPKRVPG